MSRNNRKKDKSFNEMLMDFLKDSNMKNKDLRDRITEKQGKKKKIKKKKENDRDAR